MPKTKKYRSILFVVSTILVFTASSIISQSCGEDVPDTCRAVDSDGDGLADICEEQVYGTDPELVDTDDDTIEDTHEDHDSDGCDNLYEERHGTITIDCICYGYDPGPGECD